MADRSPVRPVVPLKAKICLVGEESVGKTSLIQRFVYGVFDETYIRTLGASVAKKTVEVPSPDGRTVRLDMSILDVMGNRKFMELFREAYFHGARGIFAVADVTRRVTLDAVRDWIAGVETVVGAVPVTVAINKVDLAMRTEYGLPEARTAAEGFGGDCILTSAKTGDGVEDAFRRLAAQVVGRLLEHP